MPTTEPIPGELLAPELVLAAIDRAYRHRRYTENPGVNLAAVKAHLALPHNGATTLRLRPILQALEADGLIEQTRHRSHTYWQLTRRGHKHLAAAQDASGLYQLPESPQHQHWREAHAAAGERIDGFHADLIKAFGKAAKRLEGSRQPTSAEWYALGGRLSHMCERVASATYCLYEWVEPDDAEADIDNPPYRQGARREIQRWDED
jgi:hypothetical protein